MDTSSSFPELTSLYRVGDLTLKNRFVMSAMTRMRCDPADCVPNDLLVEYYS